MGPTAIDVLFKQIMKEWTIMAAHAVADDGTSPLKDGYWVEEAPLVATSITAARGIFFVFATPVYLVSSVSLLPFAPGLMTYVGGDPLDKGIDFFWLFFVVNALLVLCNKAPPAFY
ncbi:hypothetical protein PVK06_000147 [Gossypium arboreum]|uniref:Uncharacterized protein n=1 Tax=Gossypium arboreum TaxID=29729 RepID=A0ABR0QYP8_GOSAR|nr:hypothetical protein PVK06_000147 [Gossypium arboreum]